MATLLTLCIIAGGIYYFVIRPKRNNKKQSNVPNYQKQNTVSIYKKESIESNTVFCERCGKETNPNAKFCTNCGAEIKEKNAQYQLQNSNSVQWSAKPTITNSDIQNLNNISSGQNGPLFNQQNNNNESQTYTTVDRNIKEQHPAYGYTNNSSNKKTSNVSAILNRFMLLSKKQKRIVIIVIIVILLLLISSISACINSNLNYVSEPSDNVSQLEETETTEPEITNLSSGEEFKTDDYSVTVTEGEGNFSASYYTTKENVEITKDNFSFNSTNDSPLDAIVASDPQIGNGKDSDGRTITTKNIVFDIKHEEEETTDYSYEVILTPTGSEEPVAIWALNITVEANKKEQADPKKEEREELEAKLPVEYAWTAMQRYGENQYPYGFELHQFFGQIAETVVDKDTWFLKCEVTITNEYGAEYKTVVEANITGTQYEPEVIYFLVYE